jgi:hypothetical protein
MAGTTKQRLLALAIEHFGREELAKRLKTSTQVIDAWDRGAQPVPNAKLLALIDLLDERDALGDEPSPGARG